MSYQKRESLIGTGDLILHHMSQVYALAATASPPQNVESWAGLQERLEYYMMRGWRFT